MVTDRDRSLDLEKLRISERLDSFEDSIKKALVKIYGDPDANPPIESMDSRLKKLEKTEKDRDANRTTLINSAVGSATIAVGAFVVWVFMSLRDAFIGHK